LNNLTHVRITKQYRDKLQLLAIRNRRSMTQQLMALIDKALKQDKIHD
jgi:hypothetical protein